MFVAVGVFGLRLGDVGACGVVGGGDGVASFVADVLSLVTGI